LVLEKWDVVNGSFRESGKRTETDGGAARCGDVPLYGLSRDELRYVLDPQEAYGSDFPGETFRVLRKSLSFASLYPTQSVGRGMGEGLQVIPKNRDVVAT
jgi:hypothetical protein